MHLYGLIMFSNQEVGNIFHTLKMNMLGGKSLALVRHIKHAWEKFLEPKYPAVSSAPLSLMLLAQQELACVT